MFYWHPEIGLYTGDRIDGAREATAEEIAALEPTEEEIKNSALDSLNAEYAEKLARLAAAYSKPDLMCADETEIAARKSAIKADYQATAAELLSKQEAILNG